MKTELEQCLRVRFPEIYPYGLIAGASDDECIDYRLLRHFGQYCSVNFGGNKADEILQVINTLYQSHDLFIQNAIENEFLFIVAESLGTTDLMVHLNRIPVELQLIYVKVLLETLKHKKESVYE